jgi:hypothetical protein
LWLRYKGAASNPGRLGLILNVIGCTGTALAMLADFLQSVLWPESIVHPTGPNYVMLACIFMIPIGHVLFGIDALKDKLLPRWNGLPLLVGLTAPLFTVISMIIERTSGIDHYQLELTIVPLQTSITGLWWILMGIAMMSQRPAQQAAAAA